MSSGPIAPHMVGLFVSITRKALEEHIIFYVSTHTILPDSAQATTLGPASCPQISGKATTQWQTTKYSDSTEI